MGLTEQDAEKLCAALEEAGFDDVSLVAKRKTTGGHHIIVDLDEGESSKEVERVVRREGFGSAEVVHVTEDGCNAVHISRPKPIAPQSNLNEAVEDTRYAMSELLDELQTQFGGEKGRGARVKAVIDLITLELTHPT